MTDGMKGRGAGGHGMGGRSTAGGRIAGGRGTAVPGAFLKDTLRMWGRAWKRFASIAIITMLGVAVLTGIYAGCRDVFLAADRFYDGQHLHDIQVLSTLGLTDDDANALRSVPGVETVQPERSQSVTTEVGGTSKTVTLREIGVAGLDRPSLQEGRLPSTAGEIAVTRQFIRDAGASIGDRVTVQAETNSQSGGTGGDSGMESEQAPQFPSQLTIVGVALDPADLSNPDGYATAAFRNTLASDYTFFAPSYGVVGNVYTSISLTVAGADRLDTFSDEYTAAVKAVSDRIESAVQTDRQTARRQTIVTAAQQKLDDVKTDAYRQLDDAQRQLDDQRATLEMTKRQLADTRAQLESKQRDITDGESQIASARSRIASGRQQIASARQQLAEARQQAASGKQQLTEARNQLDAGKRQLESGKAQLQQGWSQLEQTTRTLQQARELLDGLPSADMSNIDTATWRRIVELLAKIGVTVPSDPSQVTSVDSVRSQLDEASKHLDGQRAELASRQSELADNEAKLNDQDAQLTAKEREAADGEAELDRQSAALEAKSTELETQSTTLEAKASQLASGKRQLESGLKQLEDGKSKLSDGERQLNDAADELATKRGDADREFAKQQTAIDDIADARWYVQTRDSIGGYNSLESDISSIESIGRAFPVVFLLVAVLMSLTAMTRMVEEDRGLIGTYMGLGYGRVAVGARYVAFALLACLIGGGLGLLIGFLGIPAFLMLVINGLYVVPDVRLEYDWAVGSLGVALFLAGVAIVTAVACRSEMRQTPAVLMRPKAPKAGSRILLERIRPLWTRLSFLNKVTARNIFRFKSRLVMTVGGVAGCTALIICGLAINDTVATLGTKQYGDLYRYDLLVVSSDDDADAMHQRVRDDGRTAETLDFRLESGEITNGDGRSESVQLMVIPDDELNRLNDMVSLQRSDGTAGLGVSGGSGGSASSGTLRLDSGGVIVEQSAANTLGVGNGDTVTLRDGGMDRGEVMVTAVNRNLIGSNVYISESLYRSVFDGRVAGSATTSSASPGSSASSGSSPLTLNATMATLNGAPDDNIAYADQLGRDASVVQAVSSDHMERSFKFDLMGAVVALIVMLAGALALVVLFTLANTNVSERVREMATLKVLGFFDREVHLYVNKEMTILTSLGVLVGLPLGRMVGGLLTSVLNMPGLYFEVEVRWWSYLIAASATMAFALVVQLMTNPVLDRIDPVSSLKSVE